MSKTLAASRHTRTIVQLAGSLAIAVLVFLFHLPATHGRFLFDDYADYMRAAQSPALSTWLNTDSASPVAMAALRHRSPSFRQHPWDFLYFAHDNAALRHFHGPFSFYAMHFMPSVRAERLLASAVAALTCGLIFFLLAQFEVPSLLAALLALFAGLQVPYIETSVNPSPHVWFILFAFASLYFFARYLTGRRPRQLYLTAIALALAFATLEFTLELFASIALTLALLWIFNRRLLPPWPAVRLPLLKACLLFLAATLLLWPGGWLRGGYLESYGVLGATVLFHNKTAFGEHLSAGLIYRRIFAHHIVLLLVALTWIASALWLLVRRGLSIPALVFSSYTLFAFVLGLADRFRLNNYVAEFSLFLIAAAGLVWADLLRTHPAPAPAAISPSTESAPVLPSRSASEPSHPTPFAQRVFIASACILVAIGCMTSLRQRNAWPAEPWLPAVFAGVEQHIPPGQTVLVSADREPLSLYLPAYRFELTQSPTSAEPRFGYTFAGLHYALFDSSIPLPPNTRILAAYPTTPGHSYFLCAVP